MVSKRKHYTKIITDFFTKTPENVEFTKIEYTGKVIFLYFTLLEAIHFSIGYKDTDDCTREEYNAMLKNMNMIDINTHKKDSLKKEVRVYAENLSVLEFHAMISVYLNFQL